MPNGPTLEVQGLTELRRTMKRASVDLGELKTAHGEAARVVAAAAIARAPKQTGALAGTIRPGVQAKAALIRAGSAAVPYANVIHWGWPARGITPNPWISDAAVETQNTWEVAYYNAVVQILNKIQGE